MGSLDIPFSKKIPAQLKDPGAERPARQVSVRIAKAYQ